jgi:lambda family phage portal protein
VLNRLHQHSKFEESAVIAARIGASKVGFFESPEGNPDDFADQEEADGTPSMNLEAGEFRQLPPGYSFKSWDPPYPHEAFEPFSRQSLRGICAGGGPNYESVSRDYSQSNYSSSRLSLLDDRDTWRILQAWWIRAFRAPLHRIWMQQAVLARAVGALQPESYFLDRERYEAAKFKARGWGWVDPTKEVAAYKEAEKAGYTTKGDVIAATAGGMDLEDYIVARRAELDALAAEDISTDTTAEPPPPPPAPTDTDTDEPAARAPRIVPMRGRNA